MLCVMFYLKPPATARSPINQNGTMAKDALLLKEFICAECVRYLRLEYELCGLATYASSPGCNRTLIGHYDLAAGNGWAPSGNCSPVRLLHGWLSDLELWRIRVSQPNASGLQKTSRIVCGRLSRYKAIFLLISTMTDNPFFKQQLKSYYRREIFCDRYVAVFPTLSNRADPSKIMRWLHVLKDTPIPAKLPFTSGKFAGCEHVLALVSIVSIIALTHAVFQKLSCSYADCPVITIATVTWV